MRLFFSNKNLLTFNLIKYYLQICYNVRIKQIESKEKCVYKLWTAAPTHN